MSSGMRRVETTLRLLCSRWRTHEGCDGGFHRAVESKPTTTPTRGLPAEAELDVEVGGHGRPEGEAGARPPFGRRLGSVGGEVLQGLNGGLCASGQRPGPCRRDVAELWPGQHLFAVEGLSPALPGL